MRKDNGLCLKGLLNKLFEEDIYKIISFLSTKAEKGHVAHVEIYLSQLYDL